MERITIMSWVIAGELDLRRLISAKKANNPTMLLSPH
jgi:hypothetical protein